MPHERFPSALDIVAVADGLGGFTAPPSNTVRWGDQEIIVPIRLPSPFLLKQLFWLNGSPVDALQTVTVRLFDRAENVIASGSAAQSGANRRQAVDVVDAKLPHGLFYMSIAWSPAGTGRLLTWTLLPNMAKPIGLMVYSGGAFQPYDPLLTSAFLPAMGVAGRDVV